MYSDQPVMPSSVVIFRKELTRQPASQCRSSIFVIFTECSRAAGRHHAPPRRTGSTPRRGKAAVRRKSRRAPGLANINTRPVPTCRLSTIIEFHHRDTERTEKSFVIPAKAGIHLSKAGAADQWVPACAGMTVLAR